MLGLVGDACVVDQNDGAVELHHQVGAGVEHGLGVLGAVLVACKKAVQGIDHHDLGGLGQHSDVLDHFEVASGGVVINNSFPVVSGTPYAVTVGNGAIGSNYSQFAASGGNSAFEAVMTLACQIDHMTGAYFVAAPVGGTAGNAQAPVEHHERLAAT